MNLLRSWLSTCSSDTNPPSSPPPKPPLSDTVIYTDNSAHSSSSSLSSSSTVSTNSSIQSNLSLLTLPSVQSLTHETNSQSNTATRTVSIASLSPTKLQREQYHKVVNALALHSNLLYAATGNEVNVFDIFNDNTLVDTFGSSNSSSGSVKSVSFLGGKVFTSHQDCRIRVWKVLKEGHKKNKHDLVATLPTLEDRLLRFALPNNYDKVRRHKKKLWIEHHDTVSGLAVSEDEKRMVSISWDRSVKIWEAKKNLSFRCQESVSKAHDDAINAIVVSKVGIMYTGSADKKIKAWKKEDTVKRYELLTILEKHKSAVNALALSSDESVLFSGSCDRSILVWEREDSANHMALAGALRGHSKAVLCLINVGDLLMSGSADRTVRIWRRACDDGRYCCLTVLDGQRTPVRSLVAVTAAEEGVGGGEVLKVFSGGFDGEITVWQVEM